jgi:hypothetical protein
MVSGEIKVKFILVDSINRGSFIESDRQDSTILENFNIQQGYTY